MRGNFLAERAATSYLKYTVAQITYVLRTLALHFVTHTIDFSARVTHAGIFKRPGYLLLIIPKRATDRPTPRRKETKTRQNWREEIAQKRHLVRQWLRLPHLV